MHIHFYCTFITSSQTISKLCILTIKFTFSKRKYHSLQFGSVGNRSSLWDYNTAISKTLFSLQFILFTTKQTISLSCIHVYISIFKTMHTNSSSHLYKHEKGIPFLSYASFQHTKPFKTKFNISKDFNKRANIHGHIHTQCTLALILKLPHLVKSTLLWCVGV